MFTTFRAAIAASLLVSISAIGGACCQPAHVTVDLVNGYVMDIPELFEIRTKQYEDQRASRQEPGKYLLVAGRWTAGFQFAYIAVRTQPDWDKLYRPLQSASIDDLRDMQKRMLEDLRSGLERAGARVIEEMDPVLSTNKVNDKIVLLRYRRQDRNTKTTAGQVMVVRPAGSFAVIYSFDEQVGGELIDFAILSIRRQ